MSRVQSSVVRFAAASAVALAVLPSHASACAMCMGAADGSTGEALNGAIFLMLGFIGSILATIIVSAVLLARRARQAPPAHVELNTSLLETSSL